MTGSSALSRYSSKRKGSVVVLVATMLVALVAISGLAIDVGLAYRMKARLQSACDAAALAAVTRLPDTTSAAAEARTYASLNGFTDGTDCTLTTTLSPPGQGPNTYRVTLAANYKTLFVQLVGAKDIGMSCLATAKYFSLSPISIFGGSQPGNQLNAVTAISLYGRYAYHQRGDDTSVQYLANGGPNPSYLPNGVDFTLHIPPNYTSATGAGHGQNMLKIEIFDPNSDFESSPNDKWNEQHPINSAISPVPTGESTASSGVEVTTKYSLFPPSANPNDHSHDVPINSFTEGSQPSDSQKWVNPPGWTIDVSGHQGEDYRINVQTLDHGSKNGFLLRAGPPGLNSAGAAWTNVATTMDPTMGAYKSTPDTGGALDITATGILPLAFHGTGGEALIGMGLLPPAGGTPYSVFVTDFDVDTGNAQLANITDSSGTIHTGPILAGQGDDKTVTTQIDVPASYPGGVLTSHYTADNGSNDNSTWKMYFTGAAPGQPGQVQLVE